MLYRCVAIDEVERDAKGENAALCLRPHYLLIWRVAVTSELGRRPAATGVLSPRPPAPLRPS